MSDTARTTARVEGKNQMTLGDWSALVGRILIAIIFLGSGLSKIPGFEATTAYIASKGIPFAALCTVGAIILEAMAGLMVLIGWKARWGALALAVFVAVITPIFHAPWNVPTDPMKTLQLHALFKNVAMAGGLFVLAGLGAGRVSLDARLRKRVSKLD